MKFTNDGHSALLFNWPEDKFLCLFSKQMFRQLYGTATSDQVTVEEDTMPGPVSWGGKLGDIYFDNTCPIDNFFTIFWVVCHNSPTLVLKRLIETVSDSFSKHLATVIYLVDEGKECEVRQIQGEYLGLKVNSNVLNFFGSEHG